MKISKQIIARLTLFLLTIFFAIPKIIELLIKNKQTQFTLNLFSLPTFLFILFILLFIRTTNKPTTNNIKTTLILILTTITTTLIYAKTLTTQVAIAYIPLMIIARSIIYILIFFQTTAIFFGLEFLKKQYKNAIALTTLLGIFYAITYLLNQIYKPLSLFAAKNVVNILNLFYTTANMYQGIDPRLTLENFSVQIGAACSGVDSLSLFIGLFLLLVINEKVDYKKASLVFIIGILSTIAINILRVTLIMIIGTKYPNFAVGLFHKQAGWILFSVFILALLFISYKWMLKKD
jgi:exosortase/archaeosortase family protein